MKFLPATRTDPMAFLEQDQQQSQWPNQKVGHFSYVQMARDEPNKIHTI
jgi:hypothetical protein